MTQPSIGFVSFAGGHLRWKFAKVRILRQIKVSKCFDSIEMYSEKKLNRIVSPEFAEFICANRLGFGLWIWKPIIILDFLKNHPTCELILYLDAGCDFNYSNSSKGRWEDYLSYLDFAGAVVFQTPHAEESYTRKQLVKRLGAVPEHVQSGQIQAGTFFMTRSFALKFCTEWLEVMIEDEFRLLKNERDNEASDFYESYVDYRYDQSIFSLMMKQRQVKMLQSDKETDFAPLWKQGANFPILSSRNRSIVPVLRTGYIDRAIRRIERRIIRTYNSVDSHKQKIR